VKNVFHIVILLMCLTAPGVSFTGGDKLILGRPVEREKLVDGVYEGSYKAGPNKALVKVTIKDKRLVKIDIVKHRAWRDKKAESIIPMRIIEYQSTKVDVVTGATNSSRVIMNAVQKAIEKAYER
jgi:uncharacterized protein with FMN-binding domain